MAGAKEIRGKIASIKNTRKITKALEMVAASKMRKAQDRMRAARPYAEKVRKIIGHLRQVNLDYKHPFTLERPVNSVGIVVISTDRGLCGSLNLYRETKVDQLLLAHNVFVNTMSQKGIVSQLLPIQTVDKDELQERWDYIYEPDSMTILDGILMR